MWEEIDLNGGKLEFASLAYQIVADVVMSQMASCI
jgi:hypothetical protein